MTTSVVECIEKQLLHAVFQPIGNISSGEIFGYEALIRGPAGLALEHPLGLFKQAKQEGCTVALERFAARVCIRAFAKAELPGKLFVNFSADAIRELAHHEGDVRTFFQEVNLPLERLVIELTEQPSPEPLDSLRDALNVMRQAGAQCALDDYGTGNANLSLWAALRPEFIKIDRSLVARIEASAFHIGALKCLQLLAIEADAALIAEGIETPDELMVCRDIGIAYAQGYALGKPAREPTPQLEDSALAAIRTNSIIVFPEVARLTNRTFSASRLLISAPGILPNTCNNEVMDKFYKHPDLHAFAVVKDEHPIGIISRRAFIDWYSQPYHRDLFGKKSCMSMANSAPVVLEKNATMEELVNLLASGDQRYLSDGLVLVEDGCYAGLARGEDLVRAVTEVRIEAARYANPLTFLPGNIPIDTHIKRLLTSGTPFHACYCDLNSFKPFNDQYGYWKGDEVLKLAGAILGDACDPLRDFLGHVGGDDFLILFQSEDWESRVRSAMADFNRRVVQIYTPADIEAGGIQSEDRHGALRFYGFVSLAAGVVSVSSNSQLDSDAIATLAASAKREAKKAADNFYICSCNPLDVNCFS